jgi:tRNA nucleotidyltransferase/poly(A) polymerase
LAARRKVDKTLSIAEAEWLRHPGVRAVFAAIGPEPEKIRAVGGAVRNALLGLPVADVDFATTATPDEMRALAAAAGLKTIPTGAEHGTITVIAHGGSFEVTTLREDVETDGRRAVVRFGRDWLRDAERRDFTMNALYAGADGAVFDPLRGAGDTLSRRVRFIGEPRQRIREDYLRALRFFRFDAQYGRGRLDRAGLDAIVREREGLRMLSPERVRAELFKLLVAPGAARALHVMVDYGVLTQVLGAPPMLGRFTRLCKLEAALAAPDAVRRLAALNVFADEDASRLAMRLRLSNTERKRLAACAPRCINLAPKANRALLYELGAQDYADAMLLANARESGSAARWRGAHALPSQWTPPAFPLNGEDLAALGVRRGPELGRVLAKLEAAWVASDFALTRDELLALAQRSLQPASS